jgi:hypothetical protein
MTRFRTFACLFVVAVSVPVIGRAQFINLTPAESTTYDVGNIASDGSGGRQFVVRPAEAGETVQDWKFYGFTFDSAGQIVYQAPPTPAQQALTLYEHSPLIVAIPQLAHFPSLASVHVDYAISGHDITIDAELHDSGAATATIYGPHEFLQPLPGLDTGDYHLTFNLTYSASYSEYVTKSIGYDDFVVNAVPEPGLILLGGSSMLLLSLWRFGNRKRV